LGVFMITQQEIAKIQNASILGRRLPVTSSANISNGIYMKCAPYSLHFNNQGYAVQPHRDEEGSKNDKFAYRRGEETAMAFRSSRLWKTPEEIEEEERGPTLNTRTIQRLCDKHNLYHTPNLNDVLFLHYQGFRKLEGLEEYTAVRVLWLQGNCISKIENLEPCPQLRCLSA